MYLIYSAMIGQFTWQAFQLLLTSLSKADIASSSLSPSLCSVYFSLSLSHQTLPAQAWVLWMRWCHLPLSAVGSDLPPECSETSWFVWQTQMPLNSPQPRLLTSLIPCNALFTSSLTTPPPPPHRSPTLPDQERDSHTRLPWQKIYTALTSLLQVGN